MSGNSHQKKICKKAIQKAVEAELERRAQQPLQHPQPATEQAEAPKEPKQFPRSSIEAYVFFIASALYIVLSAFGIAINFYAGAGMLLVMTYCAIDLLWHLPGIVNQPKILKIGITCVLIIGAMDLMRAGWIRTHAKPEMPDNTALVNLIVQKVGDMIAKLQPATSATTATSLPTPTVTRPDKPFVADIAPIFYSSDRRTAVMALAPSQPTQSTQVYPVDVGAEMIFTNGDHAILISNYYIEARTTAGKWMRLLRVDSTGRSPYFLSTDRSVQSALATAMLIGIPLFDDQVYDRTLQPH